VSIDACRWPALVEPYAGALREAVAFVLARFEPTGIVATGTIVRGNPGPSSDLDVYVIHRDRRRQRLQRWFQGVPAEIFVNPPERVEEYFAEERAEGRPLTAHMLATGFVVYQTDGALDALRVRAAAELASPPRIDEAALRARGYLAATLFEDAADVAELDPEASALILGQAVEAALRHRFWSAGRWQPRAKDLFVALAELDPGLAEAARAFLRAADPAERRRLAEQIAGQTVGATGFFEWESPYS
jgi:predicted nucleotidyltransferase